MLMVVLGMRAVGPNALARAGGDVDCSGWCVPGYPFHLAWHGFRLLLHQPWKRTRIIVELMCQQGGQAGRSIRACAGVP